MMFSALTLAIIIVLVVPTDAASAVLRCPVGSSAVTDLDCDTCAGTGYNQCSAYFCNDSPNSRCYSSSSICSSNCRGTCISGSSSRCPRSCPSTATPKGVVMECGPCVSSCSRYDSSCTNCKSYWCPTTGRCHSTTNGDAYCPVTWLFSGSTISCPSTNMAVQELCPGTSSGLTIASCMTCVKTCGGAWAGGSSSIPYCYKSASSRYSSYITSASKCPPTVPAPAAGVCPSSTSAKLGIGCALCTNPGWAGGCGAYYCASTGVCYGSNAWNAGCYSCSSGNSIYSTSNYNCMLSVPYNKTECKCPSYNLNEPQKDLSCNTCVSRSYCGGSSLPGGATTAVPTPAPYNWGGSSSSSSSSYYTRSYSSKYTVFCASDSKCYPNTNMSQCSGFKVRYYGKCDQAAKARTVKCPTSGSNPTKMDSCDNCISICGGCYAVGWCFPSRKCPKWIPRELVVSSSCSANSNGNWKVNYSQAGASISLGAIYGLWAWITLMTLMFKNADEIKSCCTRWSSRRAAYKKIETAKQQAREAKRQATLQKRAAEALRKKKAREDAERKERERLAEERRQRVLRETCTVRCATFGSLWRDPDDGVYALHDIAVPTLQTAPVAKFGPQLSLLFPKADLIKSVHRSPSGRFILIAGYVPLPPASRSESPTAAAVSPSPHDPSLQASLLSPAAASEGTPAQSMQELSSEYQAWLFDLFDGGRTVTAPVIQQRCVRVSPDLGPLFVEAEPEAVHLTTVALRWLEAFDPQVQGSILRNDSFKQTIQVYEDAVGEVSRVVTEEKAKRQQEMEEGGASSGEFSLVKQASSGEHGTVSKRSFMPSTTYPAEIQKLIDTREARAKDYAAELEKVEATLGETADLDKRLADDITELSMALQVLGNYLKGMGAAARSRAESAFAAALKNAQGPDENQKIVQALHHLRHRALTALRKWLEHTKASISNNYTPFSVLPLPPGASVGSGSMCLAAPPPFPFRSNTSIVTFTTNDDVLSGDYAKAVMCWDFLGSFPLAEVLDAVIAAGDNICDRAKVALVEMPNIAKFHRERGPMSSFAEAEKMEASAHDLEHRYETVEAELLDLSIKLASLTVVAQHKKKDSAVEGQLREARRECSAKKRERDTVVMGFSKLFAVRPELQLVLNAPELDFEFDLLNSYVHRLLAGGQSRHRVFEAKSDSEQKNYDLIIKEYNLSEEKHRRRFAREMDLLRKAKHPRIVAINRVFFTADGSAAYVVMPRYPGTVQDFLQNAQKPQVTTEWLRACVREAIRSVEHLHSLSILHLDIKPDNFLVDDDAMPILSDFDVSLSAEEMAKATATATSMAAGGTMGFCAPEVIKDPKSVSFKADVFSLGRTFEELIKIIRQFFPECKISPALDELVSEMVKDDAAQRPDLCDALMHKYFTLDHLEREREMEAERKKREAELEAARQRHAEDVAAAQQKLADAAAQQQAQITAAQRQLTAMNSAVAYMAPPAYWTCNDPFTDHYSKIDVTGTLKTQMQALVDQTCNKSTLGSGRDQKINMKYSRLEVQRVYRVENMPLWRKYCEKKQEMRNHRPRRAYDTNLVETMQGGSFVRSHGLDRYVGEIYGWHGTAPAIVDLIAQNGFEERLASTQGLFSSGNYFAANSSKSDQYTTPSPSHDHYNGTYYLFLARVLFGTPYETTQQFSERIPPLFNSSDPKGGRFDSLRGKLPSSLYWEYIVYDKVQCLPEFIIEYKRR